MSIEEYDTEIVVLVRRTALLCHAAPAVDRAANASDIDIRQRQQQPTITG